MMYLPPDADQKSHETPAAAVAAAAVAQIPKTMNKVRLQWLKFIVRCKI